MIFIFHWLPIIPNTLRYYQESPICKTTHHYKIISILLFLILTDPLYNFLFGSEKAIIYTKSINKTFEVQATGQYFQNYMNFMADAHLRPYILITSSSDPKMQIRVIIYMKCINKTLEGQAICQKHRPWYDLSQFT